MGGKILIVEDDPETRFMMAEFMDALGYDYELAHDGSHCIAQVVRNPAEYALILMDIHMPEVSGLEASAWIRGLDADPPRSTPIVLMSADTAYHCDKSATDLGLSGTLPKPVALNDLGATIQQHVI
ncbi:response regulator [Nereida sp. MMG025]|uniref:response regulator n=1 Tax=Nereida sp. MMG025 TaxID=2909981 RepID=UPI001F3A07EA|nr:response regulator [Nereida sp. MMG025]MCF6445335.1 response regulator [Nereida sp. MMG025]